MAGNLQAQIRLRVDRHCKRVMRDLQRAERQTLRSAHALATGLSSGPFTTVQLRKMGHPYATRDPRPPAPPEVISAQTGAFGRDWKEEAGSWQGGTLTNTLSNANPVWRHLVHGTRWTIPRPIRDAIIQRIRKVRRQRLLAVKGVHKA